MSDEPKQPKTNRTIRLVVSMLFGVVVGALAMPRPKNGMDPWSDNALLIYPFTGLTIGLGVELYRRVHESTSDR